jgi:Domain of unknown function (DUF4349)
MEERMATTPGPSSLGGFRGAVAACAAVLAAAAPACRKTSVPGSLAKDEAAPAAAEQAAPERLRVHGSAAQQGAPAAPASAADKQAAQAPSLEAMLAARKLIRTAQVAIEVRDYEVAAEQVARLAESHGGYLADAQTSRGAQDRRRGTLVIRVPAERFAAAYAALKGLGKVETETVSTQDVTKAYTDLETRLRVKRDAEGRLREILRTRTARLSDVLEAERELTRLLEEIEQIEGERRYYDQQIALSTISAALHEPEAAIRAGALAPLLEALRDSLQVLATSAGALVYLTVLLLPWAVAAALLWLVVRAARRRKRAAPKA